MGMAAGHSTRSSRSSRQRTLGWAHRAAHLPHDIARPVDDAAPDLAGLPPPAKRVLCRCSNSQVLAVPAKHGAAASMALRSKGVRSRPPPPVVRHVGAEGQQQREGKAGEVPGRAQRQGQVRPVLGEEARLRAWHKQRFVCLGSGRSLKEVPQDRERCQV